MFGGVRRLLGDRDVPLVNLLDRLFGCAYARFELRWRLLVVVCTSLNGVVSLLEFEIVNFLNVFLGGCLVAFVTVSAVFALVVMKLLFN